jgi:hypothetical protein
MTYDMGWAGTTMMIFMAVSWLVFLALIVLAAAWLAHSLRARPAPAPAPLPDSNRVGNSGSDTPGMAS